MKKKSLLALSCATVCALLFASCGSGSPTDFSANWYKSSTSTVIIGTKETLVYSVASSADSATNSVYSVKYTNGTYTTELTDVEIDGERIYRYTTRLEIQCQFFYGNLPCDEQFTDVVESTVVFRGAQKNRLSPVYSEKYVYSHSPSGLQPDAERLFTLYDYTIRTDYATDENSGTVVKTFASDGSETAAESKTSTFSFSDGYTYLDNEELLFAVRGMALTSSHQIQSYDPSWNKVRSVKISPSTEETQAFDFEMNGEQATRNITYYPTTIAYADNTGSSRTAWYAKPYPDVDNNTYRNVMLKLEDPLPYNLGKLVYSLVSATFTDVA